MSSPLVLGFNMSSSVDMDRVWPTITNREAVAVDHAWAGSPGMLHKTLMNNTVEIWAKPLPQHEVSSQSPRLRACATCTRTRGVSLLPTVLCLCMLDGLQVAILVLNTGLENVTLSLSVVEDVLGQPAGSTYRDIWQKKDVPIDGEKVPLELTAHDNVFAVFSKTAPAAGGVW
eukprot:COSAG02_NODE_7378_length_3042_cov_3.182127_4_plen_173_part_00